jgi:hypothetical protein
MKRYSVTHPLFQAPIDHVVLDYSKALRQLSNKQGVFVSGVVFKKFERNRKQLESQGFVFESIDVQEAPIDSGTIEYSDNKLANLINKLAGGEMRIGDHTQWKIPVNVTELATIIKTHDINIDDTDITGIDKELILIAINNGDFNETKMAPVQVPRMARSTLRNTGQQVFGPKRERAKQANQKHARKVRTALRNNAGVGGSDD